MFKCLIDVDLSTYTNNEINLKWAQEKTKQNRPRRIKKRNCALLKVEVHISNHLFEIILSKAWEALSWVVIKLIFQDCEARTHPHR